MTLAEATLEILPQVQNSADVGAFVFTEEPATPPVLEDGAVRPYLHILVRRTLHGTDTPASDEIPDRYRGRIISARRANTPGMQWIGHGFFHDGAEVNPAPLHDHHYRLITGNKALVRYDANTERWWLVKGEGDTPWPVEDDFYSMTPTAYIEVQYNGALTNLDAVELASNETPGHPVLSAEQTARFNNKAVVNDDGRAVQVTEFEDYTLYVGYSADQFENVRGTLWFGMKMPGRDELLHWGRWQNLYGGSTLTPEFTDTRPDDMVWAKAVVATPNAPAHSLITAQSLNTTTQNRIDGFEAFNDALNELARQQSWCGEYERVMGEIGMRSRRARKLRLYVDVNVDLSAEVESPRYQIANTLESEFSVDSVSNLRFDARVAVQVPFIVDRDDDYDDGYDDDLDADDYIDSSMVSDQVEAAVGGYLSYEVEDWSIDGGVMLSDDQDDLD